MGRNSKQRQQQHQHATELLNFRFSTSASSRQDASNSTSSSRQRGDNHGRNNRNRRRSAQDRASVRQKADTSMFHLHSSAEHTFILSRRSPSKMNTNEYSFHGSDHSVSWESVRMVQQRVSVNENDAAVCPISLCDLVCARISKCGHVFSLPNILRHVQTSATYNPYHPVKCPCCGIPIIVEDMRPVMMDAIEPVVLQQTLRLRKLHRQKASSSPFLPLQDALKHANPHFAPIAGIDPDAKFSRFNYLDADAYHALLVANQGELQREMKSADPVERMYLSLAMEMVLEEQYKAQQEYAEEKSLMTRFASPNSGMYQRQSPALVFKEGTERDPAKEIVRIPTTAEDCSVTDDHTSKSEASIMRRDRGISVGSYKSVDTACTPCSNRHDDEGEITTGNTLSPSGRNRNSRRRLHKKLQGSMYLDTSNAVHLYQAEDGQLVFLNGFNMTCLLSDFSKSPSCDVLLSDNDNKDDNKCELDKARCHGPLPDFLEGRVLEKENVHLTCEIRKRMPFLNHIPLYTDIAFVELDLNHILTDETRRKFKNEITKRRKKRQSKVQAEKRADIQVRKEDQDRINARKDRLQTVDPKDEFFHTMVTPPMETVPNSDDFGPVLGTESQPTRPLNGTSSETVVANQDVNESFAQSSTSFSFSAAAQRANAIEEFPALSSSEAFPTLGSSPNPGSTPRGGASTWRSEPSSTKKTPGVSNSGATCNTPGGKKKKKKKGQKLVLFSTGGARGY